jgi:hypothetical protein
MQVKDCRGSYLGVATAAIKIADRRAKELDQIESDLAAGNEANALKRMRAFFHQRKPIDRENDVHDRENTDQLRA